MVRRGLDRLIALLAAVIVLGYFRSVQVWGRSRIPEDRPVLLVVNHFNGFVDPVIVVKVLGRLPRLLGKSTLWNVVPIRPLLALGGVIPVYRQRDGATGGNVRSFARAEAALEQGGTVAIFPEGTTHDEPRLAEVHTGAARVALGARAAGAEGLAIVPIGLAFDDKLALRSRAFARVGEPILLDEVVDPSVDDSDREAVRALTEQVRERLQTVSPEFEDRYEHGALSFAADLVLREPGMDRAERVSFAERESLASRLAREPEDERHEVISAVATYNLQLDILRVRDDVVAASFRPTRLLRRVVVAGVLGFLLVSFAVVGLLANAVPVALVWLAGRSVRAPVTKGTVRVLAGVVAFPVAWFVTAFAFVDGWGWILLAMVLYAVTGLLAVRFVELCVDLGRDVAGWQLIQDRRGSLHEIRTQRDVAVQVVRRALGSL